MASSTNYSENSLVSSLDYHIMEELSILLNHKMPRKNWRSLAGRLGYNVVQIRNLERTENPTIELLSDWGTSNEKEKTVSSFIGYLTEMDRDDAVRVLTKRTSGRRILGENVVKDEARYLKQKEYATEAVGLENVEEIFPTQVKGPGKRSLEGKTFEDLDEIVPLKSVKLVGVTGHHVKNCSLFQEGRNLRAARGNLNEGHWEQSMLQDLAKCDFKGNIEDLAKSFYQGTRKWLFDELLQWFTKLHDSRVMALTAGPGFGKSVFAAKVCQLYQEKHELAACHFCKFNFSDYRCPMKMIQSLSSHLCQNVSGFQQKLIEQMKRPHSRDTLPDAFRVFLNDPLHALQERKPMMIVIDALDESEREGKSELLDLISREFSKLPKWIKTFITSRPELSVQKTLCNCHLVEIKSIDKDNSNDLVRFLTNCLAGVTRDKQLIKRLVARCEGSFLFAYHIKSAILQQKKKPGFKVRDIDYFVPESIDVVYNVYFKRLEKDLLSLSPDIKFQRILELVAAARGPLPLSFISEVLELPADPALPNREIKEVIRKLNESISALLLVFDNSLTVFHKTVVDWLKSDGFSEHSYTVDAKLGDEHLWRVCRNEIENSFSGFDDRKNGKALDYATHFGFFHALYQSTTQSTIDTHHDKLFSPFIGKIFLKENEETRFLGYGWRIPTRPLLMTSWSLIRKEVSCQNKNQDSERKVVVKFPDRTCSFHQTHETWPEIEVGSQNVVCKSNDNANLDYAVIKLNISDDICLYSPFKLSIQCPEPWDKVGVCHRKNDSLVWNEAVVTPYPRDWLTWINTNRRNLFENVKVLPDVTLGRKLEWEMLRQGEEYLLTYTLDSKDSDIGLPVLSGLRVVAMNNYGVYRKIGAKKIKPLTKFTCRMDKIMEDMRNKDPSIARNLFEGSAG